MILREANLKKALENVQKYSVFYYFSTEEYLVRAAAAKTVRLLCAGGDAETTVVDGPAPSIEEVIASAGTISLFGTKRVVELPLVLPSAMNDADVAALCDVMQSLENAVLVLTTVFPDDKAKTTKKAKQLIAAAEAAGLAAELTKPQAQEAQAFAARCAQRLGALLAPADAALLVERCGTDYFTLENETAKLAAAAGYGEITRELICTMGTQNIEADVFEMVRLVTSRRTARALEKLQQLLALQNEPIAIAAALESAFIDMVRVKCGAAAKRPYAAVFKDFGYRGSDYRLKKSGEAAAAFTPAQLQRAVNVLCELDTRLKSSPVDGEVLLQTALCEIAAMGGAA